MRCAAPRNGHNAVVIGDFMYIFGGQGETSFFNDIVKYDIGNLP
jgi:N-acetylneuraminic acid mutarotase